MKKSVAILVSVCLLLVVLGIMLLTACKPSSVDYVYSFGVAEWEFPGEEAVFPELPAGLLKVNAYLKSKACPVDALYYEGKDDEDADRQVRAAFNRAVSNLSKAEIDALGLPAGSWFKYRASRGRVIIGEYAYP